MKASAEKKCPICGKKVSEKDRPFCSQRCSMVDLGKWLGGDYRVQTNEDHDSDESAKESGSSDDKE